MRASAELDDFGFVDEWGPEKVVCVADHRLGMRGVLVIDNTARGMGKGGTRMAPGLTISEVGRLARVMTWKWAAVDLFFGGAKAGIRADPTRADKEAVLRAFVRRLSNEVPEEYVFGLDMGLTEHDAAIIQDELGDRRAAVGTPSAIGGIPYDEWGVTGFGVAEAAEAAAGHVGRSLTDASVVVQGFGAVGISAARRCAELGARVIAISNIHGVLHQPDGLDIAELSAARLERGDDFLDDVPDVRRLPLGAELELSTDILISAATQDVIDEDCARRLDASIIVEAANLPLTGGAQQVVAARGIAVVPDFIANAGGVVAAAFAMDARSSPFATRSVDVFDSVSAKIRANTVQVLQASASQGETSHSAARRLAADRVRSAMEVTSPIAGAWG